MKRKLLGFIIVMITMITLLGCKTPEPEFPPNFRGLWVRRASPHTTLEFSPRILKASTQYYSWRLEDIQGDDYLTRSTGNGSHGGFRAVIIGEDLIISELYTAYDSSNWTGSKDDWTGTWARK